MTQRPRLLQDYLARASKRDPAALAVRMHDESLTYGELEVRSNKLASALRDLGVQRGDRVGLLIPKSPIAVVAILAVLKADAVFVPLDTSSPASRLRKIVESCEFRAILAAGGVQALVTEVIGGPLDVVRPRLGWLGDDQSSPKDVAIDLQSGDIDARDDGVRSCLNAGSDPAYMLFTSGSTGIPKGVVISHDNVIAFVEWAVTYFEMNSSDRVSGHSPLHFDLSMFDLFGSLAAGAALFLVPPEINLLPNKLADFIRGSELTQWFSVPSAMSYMAKFDVVLPGDFRTLRRVLWCGEVLPTPTLIYWMKRLPGVKFTNLYGPTEATIASSFHTVDRCPASDTQAIPIGLPCAGEELLVLDEQLAPVPHGAVGDLYIRGVGLSSGYWRDAEKTAAAFIPCPGSSSDHERLYKTGDLASVGDDGQVLFHGRADTQIKSRGYRIELGEIESALHALNLLDESAVVAVDQGGFEGALICCAYVSARGAKTAPAEIRKRLTQHLPTYMLPARWKEYDALPKNASGKIDRKSLREQFASGTANQPAPSE